MDPVYILLSAATAMFVIERRWPAVAQPPVPWWISRLVAFNALQIGAVWLGAATWNRWLPGLRLVDGSVFGPLGGVAVGYVATTFAFYWWHRARHEVPWLWRHLHRVHHSPVRIELAMSFYKHPAEIVVNSVLMSVLLFVVLGLAPATAAAVVAIAGVAELVYHWNVRTPYWMGWLFQRPEMHRRHHERGHHRDNYSDLPLWDWLFGTFDNPREVPIECGYPRRRELDLVRLLTGGKLRNRS